MEYIRSTKTTQQELDYDWAVRYEKAIHRGLTTYDEIEFSLLSARSWGVLRVLRKFFRKKDKIIDLE